METSGPFSSFLKSGGGTSNFFMPRSLMALSNTNIVKSDASTGASSRGFVPHTTDKRNRNPNWTDAEIIRFLEILQEEDTLKDLMAQRNKQVFCYVAQRLCSEGAEKTWDQCRIKLKNLKSQYRYVKERMPEVASLDLESEDVMRKLACECQSKGISPSSLKHLRYLRRFLGKMSKAKGSHSLSLNDASEDDNSTCRALDEDEREASVSPPSTPTTFSTVTSTKLQPLSRDQGDNGPPRKRICKTSSCQSDDIMSLGQNFIERFNQNLMEQFMEHQRRAQQSFLKWELERQRQHEAAIDRWRLEVREHEKEMFGMFVQVMSECNKTLTEVLRIRTENTRGQYLDGSKGESDE